MVELFRPLTFIGAIIYFYMSTKHALHMFQQNRYELPRYMYWMKTQWQNEKRACIDLFIKESLLIGIFIITTVLHINTAILLGLNIAAMIVLTYLNIIQEKTAHYIKPLVMTARVKRQLIVMQILNIVYMLGVINYVGEKYWALWIVLGSLLQWLFIIPMFLICEPVEKLVRQYYINDAKKILRKHNSLKIVGITGSFGKTSSKHILQEILAERYYSLMTPASFNTPMGITITIRNDLQSIHEVFICEMGADKVGEIDYLTKFVRPQYGVLTSIGPQHLQTFHSLENIINEKFKIIENLPQDGIGFLNYDNEYIRNYQVKNPCKIVTFGLENSNVDFYATNIYYTPNGSVFDCVIYGKEKIHFETRLLGKHNITNILSAVAVGYHMGISTEQLQEAVRHVKYVEHRLQVKKDGGLTWIDNAFNSNPVGADMSLEVMKMMPGRRIVITPGLIDLGDKQDEYNKRFGSHMIGCVDEVYLVGVNQTKAIVEGLKESGFDMENVYVCPNVQDAFNQVRLRAKVGDTILLENDLPDAFNK
ncbi:MAG: UDP-N-acetylmuramoyl-tripeptide--D-alanyl-D-alanine ligase [Erysipelotrichales bacterium]|nr:UDP-N-acetylmuramoyl-tripeptide--D-alanyl-D-alanine ligase [Erysipelotrichales bacterium]